MAQPYEPFQHVSCPCAGSRYSYTHLAPGHIRLVVLEPGALSEEIFCRLQIFDRTCAPAFEAISYTWGDETNRRVIKYPNIPERSCVPDSCASVLRRLRYTDRQRYIWIDALSINQQDLQERSVQVRMMPRIYSSASKTIICLGENDEDSDLAMDFLAFGKYRNMNDTTRSAIMRLFRRPWFERTWVIQEVAMAKSAEVLCGNKSAPWSSLAACARLMLLRPPVLSPILRLRKPSWISFITVDQFVKALCEAAACHCRDPRDKIFAFIAMYPSMMNPREIAKYRESGIPMSKKRKAQEDDIHSAKRVSIRGGTVSHRLDFECQDPPRDRMSTDYSHCVETVFAEFANLLIKVQGLDFLSTVQGLSELSKLPSWVPDWRVSSKRTILAHIPLVQFNAGGSGQSFRTISDDTKSSAKVLIAQAVKIGKIHCLGEPCDADAPSWEQVIFDQWRALGERTWKEMNGDKCPDFLSAFIETILMDSHADYYQAREDLRKKISCQSEEVSIEHDNPLQDIDSSVITQLRVSCHGRKFFIDENGTMGLVASESLEGDLVYVLLGTKVPYTFRLCQSQTRGDMNLIGECFARGYMRNEAVSRFRAVEIRII